MLAGLAPELLRDDSYLRTAAACGGFDDSSLLSDVYGAFLVLQELRIAAECEFADGAIVSLFFQGLAAILLGIRSMYSWTFVGYVKATLDSLSLRIDAVDFLWCSVLIMAKYLFVDREVCAAAMVGEAIARPGAESRHVVVLRETLHRPEAESEDTFEDEDEAA